MMKKCCAWHSKSAGLLALRIGVGLIFIFTGWMKVSNLAGTVMQFGQMGFAPFWAYLVSFVELIGGITVLLGVYTRVAAGLLSVIMVVAIYKLFPNLQMLEFPSVQYIRTGIQMAMTPISVLFSTLALVLAGGGKYSLMKKCCGHGSDSGSCDSGSCCGKEGSGQKCCDSGTCEMTK